ncbi:hypothetical protein [Alkalicoccobacillus porphyridii]|uniref:Uncharacterized protein n=1 Tax=Alkalicoccobacillus porphyridii TaxID=2597270 RepID=A0A554A2L5_9BACI|nr:hypothetical protein [Alkalicoccobacillus porphyridii]TSB47930.1 hypothetical protein FN960_05340 [Alkalicoccobacillus porphyridii]
MISYKVYYDYHEGKKVPIWLIINTRDSHIDWEQPQLSVPVQTPFEMHPSEDFDPDAMNVTILIDDLILNTRSHTFGINLISLQQRLELHGVSAGQVDNLVIQVADIEEVLHSSL